MGLERRQHVAGAEQENTGIPQEIARCQHLAGAGGIGLFDEALEGDGRAAAIRLDREFKISVAGLGAFGGDAEGDQTALLDGAQPLRDGVPKGVAILHRVVGGGDQHDPVRVGGRDIEGGGEHRRGGVAAHRFEQDGAGIDADLGQLLGDDEAEIRIRQDHRGGEIHIPDSAGQPERRGLEKRHVANQLDELLGVGFARQRPEPGAQSAAENNRINHSNLIFSPMFCCPRSTILPHVLPRVFGQWMAIKCRFVHNMAHQ